MHEMKQNKTNWSCLDFVWILWFKCIPKLFLRLNFLRTNSKEWQRIGNLLYKVCEWRGLQSFPGASSSARSAQKEGRQVETFMCWCGWWSQSLWLTQVTGLRWKIVKSLNSLHKKVLFTKNKNSFKKIQSHGWQISNGSLKEHGIFEVTSLVFDVGNKSIIPYHTNLYDPAARQRSQGGGVLT
jgi:hypothetical protein